MAQDDSANILTDEDVKLLFKSFPDLKKKLPENASTEQIMTFMSKQAEDCGIERGAHRLLEGLAVVSAMKLHAEIALGGQPKKELLTGLNSANKQEFNEKVQNKQPQTLGVDRAECEDIRDMSFIDAVSLLKTHNEVNKVWSEKLKPEERRDILFGENSYKFENLSMIAGNETGHNQSLSQGDFTKTFGQRLINGSVGADNVIFQSFVALSRTTGSLQNYAIIEFADRFPKQCDEIKNNPDFFRTHSPEIIAGLRHFPFTDHKQDVEQLKDLVTSKSLNADKIYRGVLDFYKEVDVKTGKCPQLQYNDSKSQSNIKENNNEMSEVLDRYVKNRYKNVRRG